MAVKYTVKAVLREYTDKDGNPKKFYGVIGSVFETQKGDLMLSLESLPLYALKEGKLIAYLNDPETKQEVKQVIKDDSPFPF